MTGQAAAAVPEEVPAQTMPAGDAPEPDPAPPAAPPTPEEPAAAAAPPAEGPTFTDRLKALPADLAESVRAAEKALHEQAGFVAKSAEHRAAGEKLMADAEAAQKKRALDVVGACTRAGAKNDDDRHAILQALTDGAVSSAKKVTADQLKLIKKTLRSVQLGLVSIDRLGDGTFRVRSVEEVAS
jgi:hypothetical protein